MSKNFPIWFSVIVLIVVLVPYVFAGGTSDAVFGGFLLNPLDGNSYLAKMHLGWEGEWKFRLPYTAEAGEGAFLFLFYIFLGHISRLLGISLIGTFHLARLICSAILLWSLWKFVSAVLKDHLAIRNRVFIWCVLGTGLGWVAFLFNLVTSDFWVAEAFPFLAMYANPHFPLGMALLLWMLLARQQAGTTKKIILLLGGGLGLSIVMPFGLVLAALIFFGDILWGWVEDKELKPGDLIWLLGLGGPFLLYQFAAALSDPVLSGWNSQNQTLSPPLWDFAIAFSPALFLAAYGLWRAWRAKSNLTSYRFLIVWLVAGLFLVYFPFGLQRRFMFAYAIPCVIVAGLGLQEWSIKFRKKWIWRIAIGSSVLTSLMVVMMGLFGIQSRNSLLFISREEMKAFDWINLNTPENSLILCAPETGMFLPGYTGRRVIYGHPFETVNAASEKQFVTNFYQSIQEIEKNEDLRLRGVDYLLWGAREFSLSDSNRLPSDCAIVFETNGLFLCKYPREP